MVFADDRMPVDRVQRQGAGFSVLPVPDASIEGGYYVPVRQSLPSTRQTTLFMVGQLASYSTARDGLDRPHAIRMPSLRRVLRMSRAKEQRGDEGDE